MKTLEDKIRELPEELRREAERYLDSLLEKQHRKAKRKPTLAWAGALRDLRDRYASAELQHKIVEWWVEDALAGH